MKQDTGKNILLIFFLLGMGSTISQSLFIREFLVILFGNELILGFILFAWLLSITVGAAVFNPLSRFIKHPGRLFYTLAFIFSLLPYFLIPVIRFSREFSGVEYGLYIPFFKTALITLGVVFLPGFLIGFTFPLGCRVLRDSSAVSRVFVAEAAGALTGGVLFSFILVRLFSAPVVAGIIALLFSIAIVVVQSTERTGKVEEERKAEAFRYESGMIRSAAHFVFVIFLLFYAPAIDKVTVQARWGTLVKDLPLLANVDSPYQNLALTKQMDQYSVFFNGVYGFSFPDDYGDAMTAHHLLTQSPDPAKVLIIGEVTPGFVRECLKQPIKSISCVYNDPALFRLIEPCFTPEDRATFSDLRVRLIFTDGRSFVKSNREKFSLIYLNTPDPSTALVNRYYTEEFFTRAAALLEPEGVLVLRMTSSENFVGEDVAGYNRIIYSTLRRVFPCVDISPDTPMYLFASKSETAALEDPQQLMERYESRRVAETTFTPYLFESIYLPERVAFKRQILEAVPVSHINTDMRPGAYLQILKVWDRCSDSHLGGIIRVVESHGPADLWKGFVLLFVGVTAVRIAMGRKKPLSSSKFSILAGVFITGVAGMGFTILLILAFQNLYGYLYEKIGFLIALFMLGLALGGTLVHYLHRKERITPGYFTLILVLLILATFSLPAVLSVFQELPRSFQVLFYCLMVIAGFVSGQVFPLASLLLIKNGISSDKAAADVDTFDHLGGCLGALVLGTFLIPIQGVSDSVLLLVMLECGVLGLWILEEKMLKKRTT